MKKLKDLGPIIFIGGVVAAIIAFVLLLATPAVVAGTDYVSVNMSGTTVIFGNEYADPVGVALAAWILLLIALIAGLAVIVLDLLKLKLPAIAFLGIKLLVAVLFLVAGILAFTVASAAGVGSLGAGWVIGGILLILGFVACVCPVVLNFVK